MTGNLCPSLLAVAALCLWETIRIPLPGIVVVCAVFLALATQDNAEAAVRGMLAEFSTRRGLPEQGTVTASDRMDDGSEIQLKVEINRTYHTAKFDFTGTSPEVYSNTNAPPAVTYSAIIYVLRCLVGRYSWSLFFL